MDMEQRTADWGHELGIVTPEQTHHKLERLTSHKITKAVQKR